jgi:hypothetical protein
VRREAVHTAGTPGDTFVCTIGRAAAQIDAEYTLARGHDVWSPLRLERLRQVGGDVTVVEMRAAFDGSATAHRKELIEVSPRRRVC